ncbi:PD40 domain-containing protein [Rhodanobacter sp. L36]|uniref:PD40 domain-containing protein n=1 Tax=Rhodanobacter sp. L36 TaxID=1747221 RepID=UPI00131D219F|nr:PD40 domain-containing protein [Rhodanobacter sp. L36]
MKVFARRLRVMLLSTMLCSVSAIADDAPNSWPDTPLARTQVLALLQTLNVDLLSHDSATLTLERWCDVHRMASPARVVAKRVHGTDKPLPPELRVQLAIDANESVKYRRVQLACGDHVLSEADNWYLPNRLTAAMNRQLDSSDVPFGKVVLPLHFRRKTLSADLLWAPLPEGWEMHGGAASAATTLTTAAPLTMPHFLLQHRALLYAPDDRPFSALIETYTDQVLAFDRTRSVGTALALDGNASMYLPDVVSTKYSEVRVAVSPDGNTVLWGSVDRPGGPGGWDIWMIRRHHDTWSQPKPVSFDTAAHEFDPAFSADGKTVWFFSSRAGGLGGDDIWSASFDARSGRFGTPTNAGPAINSAGDEWAPSPSPDGTQLLFATNGRGGRGRHDLFISTRKNGLWQMAAPLPGDVNTRDDEFDATFVDGGRGLVYSHSTDADNDPVELWFAARGADGGYHAPRKLDDRVNVADGFAMGPAIDSSHPGVLLFSSKRAGMNRGRSDIYAIPFHLEAQ